MVTVVIVLCALSRVADLNLGGPSERRAHRKRAARAPDEWPLAICLLSYQLSGAKSIESSQLDGRVTRAASYVSAKRRDDNVGGSCAIGARSDHHHHHHYDDDFAARQSKRSTN